MATFNCCIINTCKIIAKQYFAFVIVLVIVFIMILQYANIYVIIAAEQLFSLFISFLLLLYSVFCAFALFTLFGF